jgi:catechol 2,3-dioxygenase-like lactoylglutathione lyase family enzyme
MLNELEAVFDRYDAGGMSRREVIGALIAMAVPSVQSAQTVPLVGAATQLNHATLHVANVQRSREFYQKLFGMPVLTQQGAGVNLRAGAGFLGLYPTPNGAKPGIDHICLSIDRFDAKRSMATLEQLKTNPEISRRGDTEELYFDDPDGISIQVQDTKYRGGVGRLGDRDPGD